MNEIKGPVIGPVQFEMKVHVEMPGGLVGEVGINLPPGRPIDQETIVRNLGRALHAAGEGAQLMDPSGFWNKLLAERFGRQRSTFATPRDWEYDLDALSAAARAAYVPERDDPEGEESTDHRGDEDFDEDGEP